MSTLLIKDIGCLVQVLAPEVRRVAGEAMGRIDAISNAWLLIGDDRILDFGAHADGHPRADSEWSASGGWVFPAWCDSHSHIVFAASREQEFVDRIKGLSYEEIARRGGGILNSAARLREASEEDLYDTALERLREVQSYGTGALEIKSGYGLSFDSEVKMLRVIRRLREAAPEMALKATFLGAHAVPPEYKNDRAAYIRLLCDKMIPYVAGEGLASYCDVFCDKGFFTVEETAEILEAGWRYGLKPKIHANELDFSGGVQVGVAQRALSVDHLERSGPEEVQALKGSGTIPTLLPSTAFFLGIDYAPARLLIEGGLPVALASDYNPGSTPSGRMPFVLSLACIKMKMLPEEAVHAATINGAAAMELEDSYGSITRGKTASFFVTRPMPSLAYLPYAFGSDLIRRVVLRGRFCD